MSAIDCGSLVMTLGSVCTIIECIISRGIGNERCFQILICGNLHANACDDDRSLIVAQNAACIREFDAFFLNSIHRIARTGLMDVRNFGAQKNAGGLPVSYEWIYRPFEFRVPTW